MSRSSLRRRTAGLSPQLTRVILSIAYHAKQDPPGLRGHPEALADLGQLAALTIPARGVLALADDGGEEIERIARRHLHRSEAEAELRSALQHIGDFKKRDAVDVAHIHLLDITQRAHYYAGLAAGLTLAARLDE